MITFTMKIRSKTLEIIARSIGEIGTGPELIQFLSDCGVNKRLIEYPQTKWRMVFSVLLNLNESSAPSDEKILKTIITESCHPLMFNGDEKNAAELENKFNNLLKYDDFIIKNHQLVDIATTSVVSEKSEDDSYEYYDAGISTPYQNTNLELYIMKKILLEHKRRDDAGFYAKEFSFANNSLVDICRVINRLIEDKILELSANTRPEKDNDSQGLTDEDGFINWDLVSKLDLQPDVMDDENGCVVFDTEVIDEVKLKGRLDVAVEEFMNDKVYSELGYLIDLSEAGMPLDTYHNQRETIISDFLEKTQSDVEIDLVDHRYQKVDIFKTLLALEKENLIRIKELRSNPIFIYSGSRTQFVGKWTSADNPRALVKPIPAHARKQEPIPISIVNMPELTIGGLDQQTVIIKGKDRKIISQKFPLDLKWTEITIKFLNGEEVILTIRRETQQTNYQALGFEDERKQRPNMQWEFLKGLAETGGQIAWGDKKASLKGKKHKQLLSDALKKYFHIDDDPFYPYKNERAYKIKINLIPEHGTGVASEPDGNNHNDDPYGINDYYKEVSPELPDPQSVNSPKK